MSKPNHNIWKNLWTQTRVIGAPLAYEHSSTPECMVFSAYLHIEHEQFEPARNAYAVEDAGKHHWEIYAVWESGATVYGGWQRFVDSARVCWCGWSGFLAVVKRSLRRVRWQQRYNAGTDDVCTHILRFTCVPAVMRLGEGTGVVWAAVCRCMHDKRYYNLRLG